MREKGKTGTVPTLTLQIFLVNFGSVEWRKRNERKRNENGLVIEIRLCKLQESRNKDKD